MRGRRGAKQRAAVQAVIAREKVREIVEHGGTDTGESITGYLSQKGTNQLFLKPLDGPLRPIIVATFDIESKEDDTQWAGFTRPFRVGFFEGENYVSFANDKVDRCQAQPTAPEGETGTSCLSPADGVVPVPGAPLVCEGVSLLDVREVRERSALADYERSRTGKCRFVDGHVRAATSFCAWRQNTVARKGETARAKAEAAWFGRCPNLWTRERKARSDWQEWHLEPEKGCIDKFCRYLFGINIRIDGLKGKARKAAEQERNRFQKFSVFGHNGGKFDMLFIIGWLLRHRDEFLFEVVAVQSRIQQLIVWRRNEGRKKCWRFLDSVSLLPMTLEKVGDTFCKGVVQKRKMDLDLHEDDPKWHEYLRDDCLVLREGLLSYQRMIWQLGGEVGITAPATAMKLFRRKFQKSWIAINKHFEDCEGKCYRDDLDEHGQPRGCSREELCDGTCHGCLHEFIRLGYYGGRTEVLRARGLNTRSSDINSSYPASMREDMPVGAATYFEGGSWAYLAQKRKTHIGFVECEVEIPADCKVPPLPWRVPEGERVTIEQPTCGECGEIKCPANCSSPSRETVVPAGKLIFPTGKLRGIWDFDELCLVLHPSVKGKITHIHRSVWFKKEKIFVDFVDTLYAFRNKDDPNNYANGVIERDPNDPSVIVNEEDFNTALAETCKLMLNSLYVSRPAA